MNRKLGFAAVGLIALVAGCGEKKDTTKPVTTQQQKKYQDDMETKMKQNMQQGMGGMPKQAQDMMEKQGVGGAGTPKP